MNSAREQIREVRDAANRLTAITSTNGQAVYFERAYDGMGRLKQDRWFTNAVVKTYLYDAAGQLTNWVVSATNGWSQSRDLRYDAGSRITTQAVNGAVRAYGYDLTDQLLSATGTQSYSGSYDALGNRDVADNWQYRANSVNAYTNQTMLVWPWASVTLTYDANGNLQTWGGRTFGHDSQGQLTNQTVYGVTQNFSYDYRRLRVTGGSGASPTSYTYDATGNLLETTNATSTVHYVYADGIDQAVLMRSGEQLYALITDHLGSVVAILDDGGSAVTTYEYHPFGKTTITGNPHGNILGFTGRELLTTPVGQFYYYRNRWYSPELGRFLEPDPIVLAGWDINLYRYVGNGPVIATDSDGLLWWVAAGIIVVVGVIWLAKEIVDEIEKSKGDYGDDLADEVAKTKKIVTEVPKGVVKVAFPPVVGAPETAVDLIGDEVLDAITDEAIETVCP